MSGNRRSMSKRSLPSNLICIIPAYNEEKIIGEVVKSVYRQCNHVLVINDGSTDNTYREAEEAGALTINHSVNLGTGASEETGIMAALLLDADIIVTLDADGQHDPSEIPKLLEPILSDEADMVIGSRFLEPEGPMPRTKRLGNTILTQLTSLLCGAEITDSQSGFRALTRQVAANVSGLPTDYSWASEMITQIHKRGFRIKEVPVRTIYNRYSLSKGTGIFDGLKILLYLIKSRLF